MDWMIWDLSHPFTQHPLPTQPLAQGVLVPFPGGEGVKWLSHGVITNPNLALRLSMNRAIHLFLLLLGIQ